MLSGRFALGTSLVAGALLLALTLSHTSQAVAQESPLIVDESFTLYNVSSQREDGSGAERWTVWSLETRIRLLVPAGATVAPESVLRFELTRGGTRVAGTRCLTNVLEMAGASTIMVMNCQDNASSIRETGEMTVTWFLIDGQTDAERQVAQHTIFVRALPVFGRGLPPTPRAPHVILDRHAEVLSTFIVEDPSVSGLHPAGLFDERFRIPAGLVLTFHSSPEGDEGLHSVTVRCRLDGQPVVLPNNRIGYWTSSEQYQNGWTVVPGATTIAESVREEYVRFYRYSVLLPLSVADAPGVTRVTDGTWECDLRTDTAETLRSFRFRVVGGRVAPHAEETEGGLVLGPGIHLAETVIPAAHPLDDRTDPTGLSRAFYGRGFRSAAARAFTVPRVGEPYPEMPRAGRSGGGRARR